MTWRRLAAATAAGLLGIHACRVYDEADTEPSDEPAGETTGGTRSGSSGGGAPPFIAERGGHGGVGMGGFGAKSGGAPGAHGGRGGAAATSGGRMGAVGSEAGADGAGADGGDPGTAPSDGGAPGDAGGSNPGGGATGGTPVVGGTNGGSAPANGGSSGGSATGGTVVAPELIDDAEDADNRIKVNQGRNGYWLTFDAAAGCTLSPESGASPFMAQAPSGTGTGDHALHFVSSGGATDGCGINLEFTSLPVKLYDASEYTGISFGARSESAAKTLLFKVVVAATDPRFEQCDPAAAADSMMQCYDHLQTTVQLTTAWREIVVPFADLVQEGWGYSAGDFDATTLVAIQWVAKPGTANVWIDDVKFVSD